MNQPPADCRKSNWSTVAGVTLSFDGTSQAMNPARSQLTEWLRAQRIEQNSIDTAALVLSELTTNAIEAVPGYPFTIDLHRATVDHIAIVVTNPTYGVVTLSNRNAGFGEPLNVRGLPIVAILADRVEITTEPPGWVSITAHLSITPEPSQRPRAFKQGYHHTVLLSH